MVIHENWVFVSAMKCATHSMYMLLESLGGEPYRPRNTMHPVAAVRFGPVHFTVTRNPYDRAVSIWASTKGAAKYRASAWISGQGGDPENFEDFCCYCLDGDPHWARVPWLYRNQTDHHQRGIIDTTVQLERLAQDLPEIVGPIGDIPTENRSLRSHWKEYMTPTAIDLINRWAAPDFAFGYERL